MERIRKGRKICESQIYNRAREAKETECAHSVCSNRERKDNIYMIMNG
jgi:hypothetical protein